LRCSP